MPTSGSAKDENKDSALAMAETALKLEPDNSYIIQQAAGAYLKMNKDDKALALFGPGLHAEEHQGRDDP